MLNFQKNLDLSEGAKKLKALYRYSGLRTAKYWSESIYRYFSQGERFSSGLIFPYDPVVRQFWHHLKRGYDHETLIKQWVDSIYSHTMVTYNGLMSLGEIAIYCEKAKVPGDFVETGTWKGGALAIMALANLAFGKERRTIHGFDSFQGIPQPNPQLKEEVVWVEKTFGVKTDNKDSLTPVNALVASENDVKEIMARVNYPSDRLKLYKGWFQETVPSISESQISEIAILRLDGDLYDSTMVCLKKFAPKVVKGGFIIIDDWSLPGARKAVEDYFASQGQIPFVHYVDNTVRYIRM